MKEEAEHFVSAVVCQPGGHRRSTSPPSSYYALALSIMANYYSGVEED
jgi:hypothetical protein